MLRVIRMLHPLRMKQKDVKNPTLAGDYQT